MEKIGKIITTHSVSKGISKELEASRICFYAKEASIGEFDVISFKGGVLTILAENPIVAQEIQMKSAETIKKINQKIGSDLVDRIRFEIR